jgi:hypothetical protein
MEKWKGVASTNFKLNSVDLSLFLVLKVRVTA